jgi:hypothetical protein
MDAWGRDEPVADISEREDTTYYNVLKIACYARAAGDPRAKLRKPGRKPKAAAQRGAQRPLGNDW